MPFQDALYTLRAAKHGDDSGRSRPRSPEWGADTRDDLVHRGVANSPPTHISHFSGWLVGRRQLAPICCGTRRGNNTTYSHRSLTRDEGAFEILVELIHLNDRTVAQPLSGLWFVQGILRNMASNVVAFPKRTAGASACVPPSGPAYGELLPFPSPTGGLTPYDTRTLCNLIFALQGEWRCQIERDGGRELWAVVGARLPMPNKPLTFLISRVEGRLLLIDISLEDRWKTLGCYEAIDLLAADLGDLVGWQSE